MTSMPYMFQKGPEWQLLEWFLSHKDDKKGGPRVQRKIAMLALLDAGTWDAPLTSWPTPDPSTFEKAQFENLLSHLRQDWFGEDENGADFDHDWTGLPNPSPPPPASRGWWPNWYGRPSEIVRVALRRAIEVSLGVDSDTSVKKLKGGAAATRDWPIEFQWICPVPWLQAGIAWRETKPGFFWSKPRGLVTVTWLTPGNTRPHGAPVTAPHGLFTDLSSPQRAGGTFAAPGVVHQPTDNSARRGHWVVGHTITTRVPSTTNTGRQGDFEPVLPSTTSTDPVMTVQPAWGDGGVESAWKY